MLSKFFPEKKCTDLQTNKEQFDFAFFLSCQLSMPEGRLEDIGTTCLFTVEKLPSWWTILTLKGAYKTYMKAAVYLLAYSTSQRNLKIRFMGDNIPIEY